MHINNSYCVEYSFTLVCICISILAFHSDHLVALEKHLQMPVVSKLLNTGTLLYI